jgi:hypothetical protein
MEWVMSYFSIPLCGPERHSIKTVSTLSQDKEHSPPENGMRDEVNIWQTLRE